MKPATVAKQSRSYGHFSPFLVHSTGSLAAHRTVLRSGTGQALMGADVGAFVLRTVGAAVGAFGLMTVGAPVLLRQRLLSRERRASLDGFA
jgi:hypothetical protein